MTHIKVKLVPAEGTDVMCIVCGGYKSQLSIAGTEMSCVGPVGIHKGCLGAVHVQRRRRQDAEGH